MHKKLDDRLAADKRTADKRTAVIAALVELIVSYVLGDRGAGAAQEFMNGVASRIFNRIQLTTCGHRVYANAQDIRRIKRESRIALQSRYVHRMSRVLGGKPRFQAHFHIVRKASESFNEDGDASFYALKERFSEMGESRAYSRLVFHALELLPCPQNTSSHPSTGSGVN